MASNRHHIFISYATEQAVLCDWLARRLAAQGYAIWYDRLKLLGGENWPTEIEEAISSRTFRMLALLSREYFTKPNPKGEWLKGQAVGKNLAIHDFVIPLKVAEFESHDLPWDMQVYNYIPFEPSWAKGLSALLKKLRAINTPYALPEGRRRALQSLSPRHFVKNEPEPLTSNCFAIDKMPRFIYTYLRTTPSQTRPSNHHNSKNEWAFWKVNPRIVLAFHDPPANTSFNQEFRRVEQITWCEKHQIHGINTQHLVTTLVLRCLYAHMNALGLKCSEDNKRWYLPLGLLPNDRVQVTYPSGERSWFRGVSKRTYRSAHRQEEYRYHLSPLLSVTKMNCDSFAICIRVQIHLTDMDGNSLKPSKIPSRRKHLCKNWFNKQWCLRTLGIAQLLANQGMHIRIGPTGEQQLSIKTTPITPIAPNSIDDSLLEN